MTDNLLPYIPEILEEHFEELQFLSSRRRAAEASPTFTLRALHAVDARIEAHARGMLAVGDPGVALAHSGLADGESMPAAAGTFVLLRSSRPASRGVVMEAFARGRGAALQGIADAIRWTHEQSLMKELERTADCGTAEAAAVALETLTWLGTQAPNLNRMTELLRAAEPVARSAAWRTLANAGRVPLARSLHVGLADDDAGVRAAAARTAAWCRMPELLEFARASAARATARDLELYRLLGVVGRRDDAARIESLAATTTLGPPGDRIALIGICGAPAHIGLLIELMGGQDVAARAAAGAAFTKMTGVDVAEGPTVSLGPDQESVIRLPDRERARTVWAQLRGRLATAQRICHGHDVTAGVTESLLAELDLASREEMAIRNRYIGVAGPSPTRLAPFHSLH